MVREEEQGKHILDYSKLDDVEAEMREKKNGKGYLPYGEKLLAWLGILFT